MTPKPSLRQVSFEDFELIGSLMLRNNLVTEFSAHHWSHLWRANPAMIIEKDFPMGWILEDCGKIVGYLGNIPIFYNFRGTQLLAAVAHGFVVDPKFRIYSLQLASAYFSQSKVDFLVNTTANKAAGEIFKFFKAEKIPYSKYDEALYWVIKPQQFMISALRKKYRINSFLAKVVGVLLCPMFFIDRLINGRAPMRGCSDYEVDVVLIDSIGMEFDEFWRQIIEERSQCVIANRSTQWLKWHFTSSRYNDNEAKFICLRLSGKLVGYAVLVQENSMSIDLKRSRIADLIVKRDDPELIDILLRALYKQANKDDSFMIEVIGAPYQIRNRFLLGNAYVRKLEAWPFWYKAIGPRLCNEALANLGAYYFNAFDGDASL